ncbi:MAG TPA: glucose-1-phosphate thymidylyltransferase [Saprospirales bacterium]|nr:glucose-1-phosphate thymidylyltransferase [Saprospirales bacterium]
MKVVIPVAGVGTRLRPHTYTQPKPLMPVAGKPILCYIVDKLADAGIRDFVFVIGHLGEKVRMFIEDTYPNLHTEFVYQEQRKGSAHAIWTAREAIEDEDEIFIAFGDTIFDLDLKLMLNSPHSCLGVKKVADPREFGVAEFGEDGKVTRMVEKPKIPKSNMAIVGLYKVKEVPALLRATEHLMQQDLRTVGEYQLTDALQFMVEQGTYFHAVPVQNWFDCGRKEVLLETNAMLLDQRGVTTSQRDVPEFENTIFIHPVSIGSNCTISHSIIGPHVTIGDHVHIQNSIVKNSIIGDFAGLDEVVLKHSVIGSDASIRGMDLNLNIGDNTEIDFG